MSRDLNKVTVSGRLGRDVELNKTGNDSSVATFSVASGRSVKDGEEWKNETEWFRVVAWNSLAERCANQLKKGSHVLIEGRLQTRKWVDKKTEQEKYTTEVIANDMYILGNGAKAQTSEEDAAGEQDDIPF